MNVHGVILAFHTLLVDSFFSPPHPKSGAQDLQIPLGPEQWGIIQGDLATDLSG